MTDKRDFYRWNTTDRDIKVQSSEVDSERVILNQESPQLDLRYEQATDTVAYIGYALPGTSKATPAWRIARLVFDVFGNATRTYADGSTSFDKAWDARATYSYGD